MDGTGWEIGGVVYQRNPKHLVTGPWRDFVTTWIAWRGNGMGAGVLPDRGGWEDQGAVLTDAFRIADKVHAELEESAPLPKDGD